MAKLMALVVLAALRLHAATENMSENVSENMSENIPESPPLCSGRIFLNSTGPEVIEDECNLRFRVDTSHCGFEVTPVYDVLDDHLQYYNCSLVVNPTPSGFEMLCTLRNIDPFSPPAERRLEGEGEPAGRRLSIVYPSELDDDAVVTWTARRPAFVDECNATISNLTARIEELEEDLAMCQTTVTTTQTSDTQTSTSLTGTSVTTATSTTVTQTTTTTAPPAVVASAGLASDCTSYLPFLIASLVLNGLLILILACQHFRHSATKSAQGETPLNQPARPAAWDIDEAGQPVNEVEADQEAGALSRATNLTGSVGSGADAGGVRSGDQRSSDTWAGRSIIYRYLRQGPRSGNEIQAASRRGWRMNAQEPPNMDDPQSAATSRAPSAAGSRATRTVQFAASEGGSSASGARSTGARSSGARSSGYGKDEVPQAGRGSSSSSAEPPAEEEYHV